MSAAQLHELLELERGEFEEEFGQQRNSLREVKEQMRRAHEEEVSAMMMENDKLQALLDEARLQVSVLNVVKVRLYM